MTNQFDVLVIGTGTAGKTVATQCAKNGLKTAIVDIREFGGTCSNRGCDPKKVLVGLTEIIYRSQHMVGKGIIKLPEISWKDLMEFKRSFTEDIPARTEEDFKELGIKMFHQSPKFISENELTIEGKLVTAKKIVIATGHIPRKLKIPGRDLPLVSDDFLELDALPESMIFIGAGYIGMELAHIAVRCGVKVTIMDMDSRPLSNFDQDMVAYLQKASEELGIKFIFDTEILEIEKLRKNFRVTGKRNGKPISEKAELVMNCSGRVPSIEELELKQGNVTFSKKGIEVNEYLQNPGNPNVYACGDVSNSSALPLTPLSSQEARIVWHNILNPENRVKEDLPPQPSVVFTLPQLASVGMSEMEAKENGYKIRVENKLVSQWFNTRRINEAYYAFKTIVDAKTSKILGVHLVGPEASEMINMFVIAMAGGLICEDLKKMVFAYPTWGNDLKGML